jgi:hypothetical protein
MCTHRSGCAVAVQVGVCTWVCLLGCACYAVQLQLVEVVWCGVALAHCWYPPPASTCALRAACYCQGVNTRQRV